ncbi:Rho-type GTPase-activating protein [Scheffersomyces amazonensis]|uniref:Rho-type GTPase-activating protein n=1 Tax=Scheffersomyces amazonensis TaxID=1078765 RepID=UPI00315CEDAB
MSSTQDIAIPRKSPLSLQACKKCNQLIYEGHAYELGDDRWHIDCFKCSKCSSSLGCNSNFLVLGNGNLICSNCSYNCKQCGKKIDDLAILTGDQAYCSNCFKCRSCKQNIEDLRYARTSKGLFCMDCHEKLMLKKKRYDAKKKLKQLQEQQEQQQTPPPPEPPVPAVIPEPEPTPAKTSLDYKRSNSSSTSLLQSYLNSSSNTESEPLLTAEFNHSSSSLHRNKTLPAPPPVPSVVSADNNDFSIEEVQNDSDDNDDSAPSTESRPSLRSKQEAPISSLRRPQPPPSTTTTNNNNNFIDEGIYLDLVDTPATPKGSTLQPPVDVTPTKSTEPSHLEVPNKNVLILSPNQFNDHEFHNTNTNTILKSPVNSSTSSQLTVNTTESSTNTVKSHTLSIEEPKSRSNCPSPFAKANRQARVVETNDEVATEPIEEEKNESDGASTLTQTPRKIAVSPHSSIMSSPPPKLPLPSTPVKKLTYPNNESGKRFKFDDIQTTPKGLGLEGVDYESVAAEQRAYLKHMQDKKASSPVIEQRTQSNNNNNNNGFGINTPLVSNLEESDHTETQSQTSISRMGSIKTPRLASLKHKRSTSGGSTSSKFGIFKVSSKEELRGHTRHVSDGSVSNASAFTTPPLPSPRTSAYNGYTSNNPNFHIRSTSDTPFLTSLELNHETTNSNGTATITSEFAHYDNFEVKSLKFEIGQLSTQKTNLETEVKKLISDKLKINDQLKSIQSKVATETLTYDALLKQVTELEKKKLLLIEANDKLSMSYQTQTHERKPRHSHTDEDLNSTASTLNNSYNETVIEDVETQKATRLKFWRRPKIGLPTNSPHLVLTGPTTQPISISPPQPTSLPQNSQNKLSQNYVSQSIRVPSHSEDNSDKKKFPKSRSTNILDSFLSSNGTGLHTNSSNDSSSSGSTHNAMGSTTSIVVGCPLFTSTIQKRADYEQVQVPLIVTKCLAEVEVRGLDVEGIYRISGASSTISNIENAFANLTAHSIQDEKQIQRLEETMNGDIHAVTSAIKRYFRKLPDPLIPYALYDDFIKVASQIPIAHTDKRIHELKIRVINRLPSANKHTLYLLCKHLNLVSSYSSVNRMGFKNLSVVFAPTIARDQTGEREMLDMGHRSETTEVLLSNSDKVFEDYFT